MEVEGKQSLIPEREGGGAFCAGLRCSNTNRAGFEGRTLEHKSLEMCQQEEAVLNRIPLGRLVLWIKGITWINEPFGKRVRPGGSCLSHTGSHEAVFSGVRSCLLHSFHGRCKFGLKQNCST